MQLEKREEHSSNEQRATPQAAPHEDAALGSLRIEN
jgi:hypothetical protein